MPFIVYDSETSGLPPKGFPPLEGDPDWPFIAQMSILFCDDDGTENDFHRLHVIAPESRRMPQAATNVHGIKNFDAISFGVSELVALGLLTSYTKFANVIVGHGIQFDKRIAINRIRLLKKSDKLLMRPGLEWVDTMAISTTLCKLPLGDGSFKWPSLDEACVTLLNEEPRSGIHDSWDDVHRTKRLYLYLRDNDFIEPVW